MKQHRFIRIVTKVALVLAILFGVVFLLRPDREAKALSFVGSGTVIDSEIQVLGTSSQYWARITCDPKEVREFVKMRPFPRHSPAPDRIQDKFSNSLMKWPSNFGDYSDDLIEFEIGKGRFAIVAFNDRGADEVLFVTWSY